MLGEIIRKLFGLSGPSQKVDSSPRVSTPLSDDPVAQVIVEWMIEEFRTREKIDLRKDEQAVPRLCEAATKAKLDLSNAQETNISLPFITAAATGPKHLNLNLTRAKLNELVGS